MLEARVSAVVLRRIEGAAPVIPERARLVAGDTRVRFARTLRTLVLDLRTSADRRFFEDAIT